MWTDEARPPLPTPSTPLHTLNMLEAEVSQRGWGEVVSLTEAANQYGSGAPSGAPAPGPPTDLLTFTPPLTPRLQSHQQSPIIQEPNADHEPLWGRKILQFQKKVVELEKNHNKMQDILDTLGSLVEGFSDPIHPSSRFMTPPSPSKPR